MNLTDEERRVLELLAEVYNAFVALDDHHPSDTEEFARSVHALQNIVASRVAARVDPDVWVGGE